MNDIINARADALSDLDRGIQYTGSAVKQIEELTGKLDGANATWRTAQAKLDAIAAVLRRSVTGAMYGSEALATADEALIAIDKIINPDD